MGASKKIMIFGSYAPSLVNFRGPLLSAMVKRGHEVIAVAAGISPSIADEIRSMGATAHEIPVSNQSLNPIEMIRTLGMLRRLIRAYRPDVLLSYTIKPVILGAIAGRMERVPTIISLITGAGYALTEGREGRRLVSRLVATRLYRIALRCSDWVVFQNQDDEQLFREGKMVTSRQKVCLVNGSGVDLDHFARAPLPAAPSFLMIARLLKDKGVREFAAAASRLKAEHPDLGISLVGYIDSSPNALSSSEMRQLERSGIEFHGAVDDVRPAIAQCSVYVLPSYREGTPRTVLEAMAMGRAIITTDAPGCRETVRHNVNGLLIQPRDADALYLAMKRFVSEPHLAERMAVESRKMAESKYDVHLVNAEFLRIAEL